MVKALVRDVTDEATIKSAYRIGPVVGNRPRGLVITFASEQDRDKVLYNRRNLITKPRWNPVKIVPDLTKTECLEQKKLHQRLLSEGKVEEKDSSLSVGSGKLRATEI